MMAKFAEQAERYDEMMEVVPISHCCHSLCNTNRPLLSFPPSDLHTCHPPSLPLQTSSSPLPVDAVHPCGKPQWLSAFPRPLARRRRVQSLRWGWS